MFFNTFVNPIALAAIAWRYYIVFHVVLIMFGLTAFFFYPETKGYSLEEIAVIFDGPEGLPDDVAEMATGNVRAKVDGDEKIGTEVAHYESA